MSEFKENFSHVRLYDFFMEEVRLYLDEEGERESKSKGIDILTKM